MRQGYISAPIPKENAGIRRHAILPTPKVGTMACAIKRNTSIADTLTLHHWAAAFNRLLQQYSHTSTVTIRPWKMPQNCVLVGVTETFGKHCSRVMSYNLLPDDIGRYYVLMAIYLRSNIDGENDAERYLLIFYCRIMATLLSSTEVSWCGTRRYVLVRWRKRNTSSP